MTGGRWDKRGGRYVTLREEAEISLLAQWFGEVAQEPTETPEATPASCMRDFGPLWAKCPGGVPCHALDECACAPGRADAVLRARMHVLEMRL